MAGLIYLDTHVVAWLYGLGAASLSPAAASEVETAAEIRIADGAPELQYLHEIGRVSEPPLPILDAL